MATVTIGGDSREIREFSAFKASKALELVSEIQDKFEDVLFAGGEFKRRYEERNYTEIGRTEARRTFAPMVVFRDVPVRDAAGEIVRDTDGAVMVAREPVLDEHGRPIIGPDPLGHLSEEDWAANDQKLRISESPPQQLYFAAMVPAAYQVARDQFLRLCALALAANSELERWDDDSSIKIEDRLEEEARALLHRAKLGELIELAAAVAKAVREEIRDPFDELASEFRATFVSATEEDAPEATPEVEPMRVETEEEPDGSTSTGSSPTSSIPSSPPTAEPAGSGSSSTEPGSRSSASSAAA